MGHHNCMRDLVMKVIITIYKFQFITVALLLSNFLRLQTLVRTYPNTNNTLVVFVHEIYGISTPVCEQIKVKNWVYMVVIPRHSCCPVDID